MDAGCASYAAFEDSSQVLTSRQMRARRQRVGHSSIKKFALSPQDPSPSGVALLPVLLCL